MIGSLIQLSFYWIWALYLVGYLSSQTQWTSLMDYLIGNILQDCENETIELRMSVLFLHYLAQVNVKLDIVQWINV